jgi:predicted metal-dependent phosphoesterase TrpH
LHSSHSQDAADNPVDVVIARAARVGMDYFVFTDHDNHVAGNVTTWSDPLYATDDMVLLYGIEYTTARGHANFFGSAPWDHPRLYALRDSAGDGSDIVAEAHAQGLHFSVNHPLNGDPWEFSFDLPYDSMEVWNATFNLPTPNFQTLTKWDELLMTGRRIPARGGSDCHHQETFEANFLNVGNPTTWIYAPERTSGAILDALAAGRASVSYAPDAERLDLTADADGDGEYETFVGDTLPLGTSRIRFRAEVAAAQEGSTYQLTIVRNGEVFMEVTLSEPRIDFDVRPAAGERSFYRAQLQGETSFAPPSSGLLYGNMIAITNPIYVGYE